MFFSSFFTTSLRLVSPHFPSIREETLRHISTDSSRRPCIEFSQQKSPTSRRILSSTNEKIPKHREIRCDRSRSPRHESVETRSAPSGQFSWISLLRILLRRWCTYSLRFKSFVYSVNVRFGWNLVTFLLCEYKRKLVLFERSMERVVFIRNDISMLRLGRCYLRPGSDISDMFDINRVTCVDSVCFD